MKKKIDDEEMKEEEKRIMGENDLKKLREKK